MKFFVVWFLFLPCFSLAAPVVTTEQSKVRLIAESAESLQQGIIGVHYEMIPDWHIYWRNPGDSGAAPKFQIDGVDIQASAWPYPKRIPVAHLVNFGFEEEAVVFLNLSQFSGVLNLEWLVCKVDCVPGFGDIELKAENVFIEPELFNKFKSRTPTSFATRTAFLRQSNDSFQFELGGINQAKAKNIHIFPFDGKLFASQAPIIMPSGDVLSITLNKAANAGAVRDLTMLSAVVEKNDGSVLHFDFSVEPSVSFNQFVWGIFLALLGGLILNLMPCVFPVLFLKAYGFLKTENQVAIRKSSLVYTAGVLASFLILGGAIVAVQLSGQALGWGFQMQNPVFIGILIVLFFLMSLSFLDIIKLDNLALPPALQPLMNSDFGTGVLAVVVASPCTAPFMGTALGLTLAMPPMQSLMIFLALGLGLALPVPILAHWPALISRLPKSGPWMLKLKKAMAIPLLGTCVWLGWVLSTQLSAVEISGAWNPYDPVKIEEMKKSQSVLIDFTASWCITCQVNKQTVLDTKEIQDLFRDHGVYLVRADWTHYNKEITKALSGYGRNSVPLYVFYDFDSGSEVILPELLTKSEIKKLFNQGVTK